MPVLSPLQVKTKHEFLSMPCNKLTVSLLQVIHIYENNHWPYINIYNCKSLIVVIELTLLHRTLYGGHH